MQDYYRPLATPLPSHPGLSSSKSSFFRPATLPDEAVPPAPAQGALSTISLLLGSHKARHPTHRSTTTTTTTQPTLLERRGVSEELSLGLRRSCNNLSSPRSRKDQERQEQQDDAIPSLEEETRRIRRGGTVEDHMDGDLPPSPVGLPGAWLDNPADALLPPPFLDDSSTKQSFEGLLGTRIARETSLRARREARLYLRDRVPPPAFPQSLFATASKLVTALGPPGGVDSGPYYRSWKDDATDTTPGTVRKERRRVQRAESGMKGYELGRKFALQLAEKLRKEEKERKVEAAAGRGDADDEEDDEEPISPVPQPPPMVSPSFAAATPMSFLGSVPHDLISPPLFAFPTPGLSSSLSSSSPFDPITPITPLPIAPPKPSLRAIIDEAEPSPLPDTPFAVDDPPLKSALVNGSDDYFTLRQRKRSLRRSNNVKFNERINLGSERPTPPPPLTTTNLLPPSSTTTSTSPSSPVSPLLSTISSPLTYALTTLKHHFVSHLDLVIWILIGSPSINSGLDQGLATVGGLLGTLLHLVGFLVFLLVHTYALIVSTCATLRSVALFGHWTFLNLTGRTDLSIVAKEYFVLCRKEWDTVCAQDGVRLGVWSVVLGLMELCAVQAMSKTRWLQGGPGRLELLNGEDVERVPSSALPEGGTPALSPLLRARSQHQKMSLERPSLSKRRTTRGWTADDGEGESLIVTGGGDNIMEGTLMNDSTDPYAYASPSFPPVRTPVSLRGMADDLDDLPPLDLGGTLPGFSFPPSPQSLKATAPTPSSPPLRPITLRSEAAAFTALLRRHARLATASYGLHTFVIDPPTPLFTPSGATLPHRVFSHLGGVDHKAVLHVAIQKEYIGVPSTTSDESTYEPQFYLLRDDLHGEIICCVRGTQSLADIRTDLEADLEPVKLPSLNPDQEDDDGDVFFAHAGILAAARRLLDPHASPLFAKLKTALEEHPGYSLVLVGHSLGANIASNVAFLLGEYHSDLPTTTSSSSNTNTPTGSGSNTPTRARARAPSPPSTVPSGRWTINSTSGLPPGRPIRAICFAHPASVSPSLSLRCSLGSTPLVLSISLYSDAVTRMGVPQVRELRRALGRLAENRAKWLSGRKKGEHGKSEILKSWWRWKKLGGNGEEEEGKEKDEEKMVEKEEIEEKAWRWRCEMDGIGKELLSNGANGKGKANGKGRSVGGDTAIPCGRCYHLDRLPIELEVKRKEEMEKAALEENGDDEEDEDEVRPVGLYKVVDPSRFYSMPLLEADAVASHLPKAYLDAVDAL